MELSLSSCSSCFICGATVKRIGRPRKTVKNEHLKDLMWRLCELLTVFGEISAESWNLLTELELQSFCCVTCFQLLEKVDKLHGIIVKSQEALTKRLQEVQVLIVKSECDDLQNSMWNPGCFELRKGVLKRLQKLPPNDRDEGLAPPSASVAIKTENPADIPIEDLCSFESGGDVEETVWEDDWDDPLNTESVLPQEEPGTGEKVTIIDDLVGQDLPPKITVTVIKKSSDDFTAGGPKEEAPSSTSSGKRRKKRKIVVVCDEDDFELEPPVKEEVKSRGTAGTSRMAMKKAKIALQSTTAVWSDLEDEPKADCPKQVEDNDSDGDYNCPSSPPKADASDATDENEEEDDAQNSNSIEEDPNINQDTADRTSLPVWKRPPPPGSKRTWDLKKTVDSTKSFYPMMYAQDNLYMYRFDTFVTKTVSHLRCEAYKCVFQTEFDYQPSFQRMREHIEENHRTKRHFQFTPHPCLLCHTVFPNREAFHKHLPLLHYPPFHRTKGQAICECCLRPVERGYIRAHHFSHKNAEEKALARASKEYDLAYFRRKKESEITEKKYKCSQPNCPAAFKSSGNLRRHERSHQSWDERTDLSLCPECGKRMLTSQLPKHLLRIHHPEMVTRHQVCPICDKRFLHGDVALYNRHLKGHRGEKPWVCEDCGAAYVTRSGLDYHRQAAHVKEEEEKFPCEFCESIYTKKGSLVKHVNTKHPEKRVRKIIYLPTSFYAKKKKVEGVVFGPVQMFPCPHCGVVCSTTGTLKVHLFRKHGVGKAPGKRKPLGNYRRKIEKGEGGSGRSSESSSGQGHNQNWFE